MPHFTEYPGHHRGGFLDQPLHMGMVRHALGIGVGAEGAEPQGEVFLVFHVDFLITEINHFVTVEGGFDLLELAVAYIGDIHPPDFRAHGAGQGHGADFRITVGFIVVVGRRVKLHGLLPLIEFLSSESYPSPAVNCMQRG